jgi:hypothetical protein
VRRVDIEGRDVLVACGCLGRGLRLGRDKGEK